MHDGCSRHSSPHTHLLLPFFSHHPFFFLLLFLSFAADSLCHVLRSKHLQIGRHMAGGDKPGTLGISSAKNISRVHATLHFQPAMGEGDQGGAWMVTCLGKVRSDTRVHTVPAHTCAHTSANDRPVRLLTPRSVRRMLCLCTAASRRRRSERDAAPGCFPGRQHEFPGAPQGPLADRRHAILLHRTNSNVDTTCVAMR